MSIITSFCTKMNATFNFPHTLTATTAAEVLTELQVAAASWYVTNINVAPSMPLSPTDFAVLIAFTEAVA